MRLLNEASKDFFKPGFAKELLHGSDTEELLLVGIKASLGNGCGDGSIVYVLAVGAAFDELPRPSTSFQPDQTFPLIACCRA